MRTNLQRSATAVWKGTGLDGTGEINTLSSAITGLPYSNKSRFQNEDGKSGSNPEELLAAAHAACFNMALSFQINGAGFTAKSLETRAEVFLDREGYDYTVSEIMLDLKAMVPGMAPEQLQSLAEIAKNTCPISQALRSINIELRVEMV